MTVVRRPTSGEYPPKYVQQPNAYWRKRGLVLSFLGNRLIYSRDTPVIPTLTPSGTPKNQSGPHSDGVGFGTTYGTGATDMLTGGVLPVTTTGKRSMFTHLYRNGTGGGAVGRVFQDVTGTGINGGESFYCNGTTQIIYNNYIVAGGSIQSWVFVTTPPVSRWATICVTIPDMTGVATVGTCYIDGKQVTTVLNAGVAGGLGSNVATNLTWGNRTTSLDRNFDGIIGITHFFDTELSAEDVGKLDQNPNCVWATTNVRRFVSAGGGTTYTLSPGGTTSLSGAAPNIRVRVQTSSGTVVLSGNAAITYTPFSGTTYTLSVGGSVTLSGATSELRTRAFIPSGGVLLSGASPNIRVKVQTPSGGVTFSGTISYNKTRVLAPNGSVVFSGSAPLINPFAITTVTTWRTLTGMGT